MVKTENIEAGRWERLGHVGREVLLIRMVVYAMQMYPSLSCTHSNRSVPHNSKLILIIHAREAIGILGQIPLLIQETPALRDNQSKMGLPRWFKICFSRLISGKTLGILWCFYKRARSEIGLYVSAANWNTQKHISTLHEVRLRIHFGF